MVKSYTMSCMVESASLEPTMGNMFVAGGEDLWVRLFDFHTGEEIACNKGHHGPVHCVRFAPGGESYSSGSEDGTIKIWQTLNEVKNRVYTFLTGDQSHPETENIYAVLDWIVEVQNRNRGYKNSFYMNKSKTETEDETSQKQRKQEQLLPSIC